MKWSTLQKERKCTHSFCELYHFRERRINIHCNEMVYLTKKCIKLLTLFVTYTILENREKMFTGMKWSSLQKE